MFHVVLWFLLISDKIKPSVPACHLKVLVGPRPFLNTTQLKVVFLSCDFLSAPPSFCANGHKEDAERHLGCEGLFSEHPFHFFVSGFVLKLAILSRTSLRKSLRVYGSIVRIGLELRHG
jgi:hypothetical protein